MRRTRSYKNRKTYQNRGQKVRLRLSRATGRIRKALSYGGSVYSAHKARKGWQTKGAGFKRKRYYKRNLSY